MANHLVACRCGHSEAYHTYHGAPAPVCGYWDVSSGMWCPCMDYRPRPWWARLWARLRVRVTGPRDGEETRFII